jgi:hypothetical protein
MINMILSDLAICRESLLYSKLKKVPKVFGQLKPTNIFLMDKHYKYVYRLWKELGLSHIIEYEDLDMAREIEITDEYFKFVYSMLIFTLYYSNYNTKNTAGLLMKDGAIHPQEFGCFLHWKCTIQQKNIQPLGLSGIECSLSLIKEYSTDVADVVCQEIKSFPVRIKGNRLIITRVLKEDEIGDLCASLYPDIGKYGGLSKTEKVEYRQRREHRRELKEKLLQLFCNGEREYKVLIVPMYAKFKDCSTEAKNALNKVFHEIVSANHDEGFNAVYITTPFSPFDYDGTEHLNQDDAKQLLRYASLENIIATEQNTGVLPISIGDVNSFRRITKLILLAMMAIGSKAKICPVCGEKLYDTSNVTLVCYTCSFELMKARCSYCGQYYVRNKNKTEELWKIPNGDIAYKLLVSEMVNCFTNLVDIDIETETDICPFCGKTQ